MSGHTKGPWAYTYKRDPSYGDGEITDADGNMIAIISGSNYGVYFGGPNRDWEGEFDDADEHEANARLIAAAPDLLEAIESVECEHELLRWMKNCELRRPRGSFGIAVESDEMALEWQSHRKNLDKLAEARRAAIARARGEK